MIPHRLLLATSWALSLLAGSSPVAAQCHVFDPRFSLPGVYGSVRAFAVFDDGSGPALYAGGVFETAGGALAKGVARWDGTHWERLGDGISGTVHALAAFDDGSGPALYAAGFFQNAGGVPAANIARWNGTAWSPVGAGFNSAATCLAVFDDGSGAALYAGNPLMSGTILLNGLAKWNGSAWSMVGGGVGSEVLSMAVYDPGTGSRLYVGGDFQTVGAGIPAQRIASWNGSSWSALGPGLDDRVRALAVHGNRLYAGGFFVQSGSMQARRIHAWDGVAWSDVGGGLDGACNTLASVDVGNGPILFAGGFFTQAGSQAAAYIAAWDGTAWTPLTTGTDEGVMALGAFDSGSGTRLYVGGFFGLAGGLPRSGIASWRNGWSSVIDTGGQGLDGAVMALATLDLGSGPRLFAAGSFESSGSVTAARIASWNGTTWSALGMGLGNASQHHVDAIAAYDDGGGLELYAGGDFFDPTLTYPNYIGRWDGTNWNTVGLGVGYAVSCLVAHDDGTGPALFAGGYFTAADQAPAMRIARWDGVNWSPLGTGMDAAVRALAVYDDGSGPALFAAGSFTVAGGVPAAGLAKWDGSGWSAVGGGVAGGSPVALLVHDDGSGSALYVAGGFTTAGGMPANHVARWNGTAWSGLGGGLNDLVLSLGSFDDGNGRALYAGDFTSQAGQVAQIWRWEGAAWSSLPGLTGSPGGGSSVSVRALAVFDDGSGGGPDLYAGGDFTGAGNFASVSLAEWHGCSIPFTIYCSGDGSGMACPCGNAGSPGNGCGSNTEPNGAHLAASGTASIAADTLVLTATGVPNGSGLFFQGTTKQNGGLGTVFGDGLRCVGGQIVRLGIITASGNTSHYPRSGIDQPISTKGMNAAGSIRNHQMWYREAAAFCTPSTFNLTNGVNLTWLP